MKMKYLEYATAPELVPILKDYEMRNCVGIAWVNKSGVFVVGCACFSLEMTTAGSQFSQVF